MPTYSHLVSVLSVLLYCTGVLSSGSGCSSLDGPFCDLVNGIAVPPHATRMVASQAGAGPRAPSTVVQSQRSLLNGLQGMASAILAQRETGDTPDSRQRAAVMHKLAELLNSHMESEKNAASDSDTTQTEGAGSGSGDAAVASSLEFVSRDSVGQVSATADQPQGEVVELHINSLEDLDNPVIAAALRETIMKAMRKAGGTQQARTVITLPQPEHNEEVGGKQTLGDGTGQETSTGAESGAHGALDAEQEHQETGRTQPSSVPRQRGRPAWWTEDLRQAHEEEKRRSTAKDDGGAADGTGPNAGAPSDSSEVVGSPSPSLPADRRRRRRSDP